MRLSKLKRVRRNSGLSQEALAEVSGVSRATICDLENLHRSCWPKTASKIADALDVYVSDLLEDDVNQGSPVNYHRLRIEALEARNAELVSMLASLVEAVDACDPHAVLHSRDRSVSSIYGRR